MHALVPAYLTWLFLAKVALSSVLYTCWAFGLEVLPYSLLYLIYLLISSSFSRSSFKEHHCRGLTPDVPVWVFRSFLDLFFSSYYAYDCILICVIFG